MSYSATVFNVMIASPSDVDEEREIIRDVIYEWNDIYSFSRNLVLLPIDWKSHSSPEMGDAPQSIINKQVLAKSDILIGVFWTRIGTPTTEYSSGTVEEIEKHIKDGKLAMLYFSSKPVVPDSVDTSQLNLLKLFKELCRSRGLCEDYSDINDFKAKFNKQLQQKINEHELFRINDSNTEAGTSEKNRAILELSDEAKTMLKEISLDTRGQLRSINAVTGMSIGTNRKEFNASQEPREIAKWKGAIQILQKEGLIQKVSSKNGEIYTITDLGYNVADTW